MLGWHISVYRLQGNAQAVLNALHPDTADQILREAAGSPRSRIAVWQAGLDGLDWIDQLVEHGQAIALPGNGYPNHFFAPAHQLLTALMEGPPEAKEAWTFDAGDVIGPAWEGRTVVDEAAAAECRPDEWLLVEAWDES
jgi:hypothetical protein